MHYVYVLLLNNDKFYTGYTATIKRRIYEHKLGKVRSTRNYRPLKLVFCEIYLNKKDALRREHYFKIDKGRSTLRLMLREYLQSI
jgi:putative endonuclease